jgi:hypothetical protein
MSRLALVGIASVAILLNPLSGRHASANDPDPDYAALQRAVLDGKEIRMVLDLSACQVQGSDKSGPPIKASLRFDGYMVQSDGTIAFSTTHFTVRPDKTPVDEFQSFRVRSSGKIDMHAIFLNPVTFAVLQEAAFDCNIGNSATFHW